MFEPDLRRTQDMPGAMKRDADSAVFDRLAIRHGVNVRLFPEPRAKQVQPRIGGEIPAATPPRIFTAVSAVPQPPLQMTRHEDGGSGSGGFSTSFADCV